MATVTADDIRALAQARGQDHVLVLTDGEVEVVTAVAANCDAPNARIIYTQVELLRDLGVDVTDAEAETLAGALTARITPQE